MFLKKVQNVVDKIKEFKDLDINNEKWDALVSGLLKELSKSRHPFIHLDAFLSR